MTSTVTVPEKSGSLDDNSLLCTSVDQLKRYGLNSVKCKAAVSMGVPIGMGME